MSISKPTRADVRDYVIIALGVIVYAIGYSCFMLPYKIVTGGLGGICALIYYSTDIPAQYPYAIINGLLLVAAIIILGWKFLYRTIWACVVITIAIDLWQIPIMGDDGHLIQLLGPNDRFMACVIGAIFEGIGIATAFLAGGSSGGMDIVAAIVNKYKNVSLGRVILVTDFVIVTCSWFIFKNIESIVVGVVTLVMANLTLDFVINTTRGSVQFLIITQREQEMAEAINKRLDRGVTLLHGEGWYSKQSREVLMVLCRRREAGRLFRLIHEIDPQAFVSQSTVTGVYGEGFDAIKA